MKIILAPTYELAEKYARTHTVDATVEAEYGDKVVKGKTFTLAHHGPRSGNPAPCNDPKAVKLPDDATVLVSHIDLDTLGGIMALQGIKPEDKEFWRAAEFIDVNGPHHIHELPQNVQDKLNAYYAFEEEQRKTEGRPDREHITDVTNSVWKHSIGISTILGEKERLPEGVEVEGDWGVEVDVPANPSKNYKRFYHESYSEYKEKSDPPGYERSNGFVYHYLPFKETGRTLPDRAPLNKNTKGVWTVEKGSYVFGMGGGGVKRKKHERYGTYQEYLNDRLKDYGVSSRDCKGTGGDHYRETLEFTRNRIRLPGHDELIQAGRKWEKESTKAVEDRLVEENKDVRMFSTDGVFCNGAYYSPKQDKIIPAVVSYNERLGSITLSFADGGKDFSAREIVQSLWGPEAGGRDGIAGSPRGKMMTKKDLKAAYEKVTELFLEKDRDIERFVESDEECRSESSNFEVTDPVEDQTEPGSDLDAPAEKQITLGDVVNELRSLIKTAEKQMGGDTELYISVIPDERFTPDAAFDERLMADAFSLIKVQNGEAEIVDYNIDRDYVKKDIADIVKETTGQEFNLQDYDDRDDL